MKKKKKMRYKPFEEMYNSGGPYYYALLFSDVEGKEKERFHYIRASMKTDFRANIDVYVYCDPIDLYSHYEKEAYLNLSRMSWTKAIYLEQGHLSEIFFSEELGTLTYAEDISKRNKQFVIFTKLEKVERYAKFEIGLLYGSKVITYGSKNGSEILLPNVEFLNLVLGKNISEEDMRAVMEIERYEPFLLAMEKLLGFRLYCNELMLKKYYTCVDDDMWVGFYKAK